MPLSILFTPSPQVARELGPQANGKPRKPFNPCAVTARQNWRDLQESYGFELPDDDAGRDDAELMLSYLAHVPNGAVKAENFLELWCPWMPARERDLMLRDAALSPPPRMTADQLAARLGTTYARRQKLRHTMIGAVDADKAERARRKKERDSERSRRRKERERRASGKPTREQYLADAAAKREQREAAGVSPRTWYRQQAAAKKQHAVAQVGTAVSLDVAAGTTCATSPAGRAAAAENNRHQCLPKQRLPTRKRREAEQKSPSRPSPCPIPPRAPPRSSAHCGESRSRWRPRPVAGQTRHHEGGGPDMSNRHDDELVVPNHPHVDQRNWHAGDDDDEYEKALSKFIDRKILRTWKRLRTLMRVPPVNVAERLLPHVSVSEVLDAGIYLQVLAHFMVKQTQWKCAECGRDVLVAGSSVQVDVDESTRSPEVTRTMQVRQVRRDARYCSATCRQKAFRKRKRVTDRASDTTAKPSTCDGCVDAESSLTVTHDPGPAE